MANNLEKSILSTIIFYDLLGLPLTGFELCKYLIRDSNSDLRDSKPKLSDVLRALESSDFLKEKLGQKLGFYFLAGRENLVGERIEKQKLADLKWRKMRKYLLFFRAIPFLKAVLVTGSFALGNVKPESDFDVLVVGRHGRIWTVRFFATLFFYFLGVRRSARKIKDRVCLSHYISDQALAIRCRNIYEAQYYARAIPLIETEKGFYSRFCRENDWLADYLFFWPPDYFKNESADAPTVNQRALPERGFLRFLAKIQEKILDGFLGDFLEKKLEAIQKFHINRNPLKYLEGERSRTDDFELEFRPNSHSLAIVEEYDKRTAALV